MELGQKAFVQKYWCLWCDKNTEFFLLFKFSFHSSLCHEDDNVCYPGQLCLQGILCRGIFFAPKVCDFFNIFFVPVKGILCLRYSTRAAFFLNLDFVTN